MFVEEVDSEHSLTYRIPLNRPLALIWGASGKSILASLPQHEMEKAIEKALQEEPPLSQSKASIETLHADLDRIRADGFAMTRGERMIGAVGIAAPIRGPGNRVVGSLGTIVPEIRYSADTTAKSVLTIQEHAARISRALGAPEVVSD
jgi:DNA-binding IclR family transcriptional regulator